MFFHIWTIKGDTHWATRLCIYNLKHRQMSVLEKQDRVSHYAWKNDNELIVTCWDAQKRQYYCLYHCEDGNKHILKHDDLCHDGHPAILRDGKSFVSDTYPLAHDMQTVFEYEFHTNLYRPLIRLYSDARLYDEKRCDLHPRISPGEKYITMDTACENKCRQVLLLKNWKRGSQPCLNSAL